MAALPPPDEAPKDDASPDGDVISEINRRLVRGRDPLEIVLWTQIRAEVVQQDQDALDRQAARRRQIELARLEIAKGFLAVSLGTVLILYGYWLPGFLCLGAGLYSLAPDYVKEFGPRRLPRGTDDDQK